MPSGTPQKATPEQVAKYGHMASLIRKYMAENDLKAPDFAKSLGMDVKHLAQLYKWIGAKAGPGKMYRPKIAKLLGVSQDEIKIRTGTELMVPRSKVEPMPRKVGDVLQFSIDSDGNTRLKFDATLPAEKGIPLLKIVLATAELMKDLDGDKVL